MVLEYVAGRSLAQQVKQERPALRAAALLVAQVAKTLERVHQQGVLHRDLKPANILIDGAGRPRLLDFGLACVTPQWSDSNLPEEGVSGTLQYMAPEQAAGHVEQVGPRSDVFGLGAVLYHLLTGQPPYQGTDLRSVWDQARQGEVTPVRQLNPRVPRRLERICMKALARDPGQRYGSAGEMARALQGYLGRRRVLTGALGLLTVAALGILAVALGPGKRSTPPATGPAPAAPAALSGDLVVRVWTPGGGKRGLKVGEDVGALPVRNGEQVHLEAHVNQPAYLYVLWVDLRGPGGSALSLGAFVCEAAGQPASTGGAAQPAPARPRLAAGGPQRPGDSPAAGAPHAVAGGREPGGGGRAAAAGTVARPAGGGGPRV